MVEYRKETSVYLKDIRIATVAETEAGYEIETYHPLKPFVKQCETAKEAKELCEELARRFITYLGKDV
jgi:hypothetical protein